MHQVSSIGSSESILSSSLSMVNGVVFVCLNHFERGQAISRRRPSSIVFCFVFYPSTPLPRSPANQYHPFSLGFPCVLLGFTGFLLGFIRFHRDSLGFTGLKWFFMGFTRFYWVLLG